MHILLEIIITALLSGVFLNSIDITIHKQNKKNNDSTTQITK